MEIKMRGLLQEVSPLLSFLFLRHHPRSDDLLFRDFLAPRSLTSGNQDQKSAVQSTPVLVSISISGFNFGILGFDL